MVVIRRWLAILSIMLALMMIAPHAAAQATGAVTLAPDQQQLVLEEALQLYDEGIALRPQSQLEAQGKFADSAQRFELLIQAGVKNGAIYYNLGNAQLQAGRVGEAIVSYRRALKYMPGDSRVESNLEFARSQVRSQIPMSGQRAIAHAVLDAVGFVPWSWRLLGAAGLYLLIWVLAAMRLKWSVMPRWLVWTCALGALMFGVTVAAPQLLEPSMRAGVIVAEDVIVRMGNGEGFEPQFAEPISEGVEFSVIERRGDWLEIELPNGGRGWIRSDQAELI